MPQRSVPEGLVVPGSRQPQAETLESEVLGTWPAPNGHAAAQLAANGHAAAQQPADDQAAGELANDDNSWPGVTPPAGWFLRAPRQPRAASPASDPDTQDTAGQDTGELNPWQKSHQLWTEAGIQWEQQPQASAPEPPAPWHAPSTQAGPRPRVPEPAAVGWAGTMPLGAPVFSVPDVDDDPASEDRWGHDRERPSGLVPPAAPDDTHWIQTSRRPRSGPGLLSRRITRIVGPAIVAVAVAVLALGLLTGHGPKSGPPTANQHRIPNAAAPQLPLAVVNFGTYPGQQQRGVFQAINRVVAAGRTMVTMGSQTSDGVVRQQFLVSTNAGASWHLAPLRAPGGGQGVQAALGHPAARLAGGPGGWVAVGPQAIWTSPTGLTWTLAATHGISPELPGDSVLGDHQDVRRLPRSGRER